MVSPDKKKIKAMFVVFLLCGLPITQTKADFLTDSKKVASPTISIIGLDVDSKTLKLSYRIRNDSQQDVWILAGFGKSDAIGELFMDKDDQTIVIRRRLYVPYAGGNGIVDGRYVLMRPGAEQNESLSIALPVYPEYVLASRREPRGLECATRLAIEIGY